MTRAEIDDQRALEERKLATMAAMTLAWPTKGVVTIDLASGLVTSAPGFSEAASVKHPPSDGAAR